MAKSEDRYPCPCCGYLMFDEPVGSYDICNICFWEDDFLQLAFPEVAWGPNKVSLIEGQASYNERGVSELRLLPLVRPAGPHDIRDYSWRPLDVTRDRYPHWNNPADRDLYTKHVKNARPKQSLYYWRPDYWLRNLGTTSSPNDQQLPGH